MEGRLEGDSAAREVVVHSQVSTKSLGLRTWPAWGCTCSCAHDTPKDLVSHHRDSALDQEKSLHCPSLRVQTYVIILEDSSVVAQTAENGTFYAMQCSSYLASASSGWTTVKGNPCHMCSEGKMAKLHV